MKITSEINLKLIKKLRRRKNLTQAEMASRLGLNGADKYNRRECGIYQFKVKEIPTLAKILGIPIEKIFVNKLPKSQV